MRPSRRPCSCRAGSRRGRSAGALLGDARHEVLVDLVDERELAGLRLLPLAVPALQLARDVALVAAEVAEADGVEVDGVDVAPGCRRATRPRVRRGVGVERASRRGRVANDVAVDEVHHVERRAVDSTSVHRSRARGRPARRSAPRPAMMRCSRPMSWAVASTWPSGGRRSTQRVPGRVGDLEREVRVAAGDQRRR